MICSRAAWGVSKGSGRERRGCEGQGQPDFESARLGDVSRLKFSLSKDPEWPRICSTNQVIGRSIVAVVNFLASDLAEE